MVGLRGTRVETARRPLGLGGAVDDCDKVSVAGAVGQWERGLSGGARKTRDRPSLAAFLGCSGQFRADHARGRLRNKNEGGFQGSRCTEFLCPPRHVNRGVQ